MRRTYIDGKRVWRTKPGEIPMRAVTLGQVHHVMIVEGPLCRIALGWARWLFWYRWRP